MRDGEKNLAGRLTGLLALAANSRVTLVGCGGKTTIMNLLAREYKDSKVLMTTTTKIRIPDQGVDFVCSTLDNILAHKPAKGIQCLGEGTEGGKLKAMPPEILAGIIDDYDITLIEGDGSKLLPLKGWADYEPVVPEFTTHTIGVVTLNGLGKQANEEWVHRLTLFLETVGIARDSLISLKDISRMICHRNGMFKASQGLPILLINQVEDKETLLKAIDLGKEIRKAAPFLLHSCLAGSAVNDSWYRLW